MKTKTYICPKAEIVNIKGVKVLLDFDDNETTSGNQEDANAKRLFSDTNYENDLSEEMFDVNLWE